MPVNNEVGAKIRGLREMRQVSIEELAERSHLSVEQISRIENGEAAASLTPLLAIARGLGVRLGTFLDDAELSGPVVSRNGAQEKAPVRFAGGAGQGHIAPPGSGRGLPEGPQVPPALPLVRQVFADHEVLLPLFRAARLPDDGVSLLKHHLKGLHKGPVERLPQGRRDLFIQLPVQGRLRRRPVALQKPLFPLPHLAVRLGPGGLPP